MTRTSLTSAELRMLKLAAQGYTTTESGAKMGVTFNTVKTHRRNLCAKLDAANMPHAVAIGYAKGLLP